MELLYANKIMGTMMTTIIRRRQMIFLWRWKMGLLKKSKGKI